MKRRKLIVYAVILLIASFALYLRTHRSSGSGDNLTRAREATLNQDLLVMREAIHNYSLDKGRPPESLEELVSTGYLRTIPVDPMTRRNDWAVVPAQNSRGIVDVHSASRQVGRNGVAYNQW